MKKRRRRKERKMSSSSSVFVENISNFNPSGSGDRWLRHKKKKGNRRRGIHPRKKKKKRLLQFCYQRNETNEETYLQIIYTYLYCIVYREKNTSQLHCFSLSLSATTTTTNSDSQGHALYLTWHFRQTNRYETSTKANPCSCTPDHGVISASAWFLPTVRTAAGGSAPAPFASPTVPSPGAACGLRAIRRAPPGQWERNGSRSRGPN